MYIKKWIFYTSHINTAASRLCYCSTVGCWYFKPAFVLKKHPSKLKCTAGVYLLMRSSPLIEYSSTVLLICLWLGAITTVFSSLVGLFQQDIKKVIAYSTMSQLGMMVIAVGLSSYNIALFHLVNHAFYKALLFLGAGAVIHAVADNQDFRKYGGLRPFLPLTYSVMLIASLSLVAFPFTRQWRG